MDVRMRIQGSRHFGDDDRRGIPWRGAECKERGGVRKTEAGTLEKKQEGSGAEPQDYGHCIFRGANLWLQTTGTATPDII